MYRIPFYATLGFVTASLPVYSAYRCTLDAVNRQKLSILATMSAEEIEAERMDGARYADRKWAFMHGL